MQRGSTARRIAGGTPWLALAFAACAAPLHPAREGDSLRVAVAPLNLAVELPPDLAPAVEPVQQEILRHLIASGARVGVVWPADARLLWHRAVVSERDRGGGDPALRATAGEFVRSFSEQSDADFDLLVLPSLLYRQARIRGQRASWDGVEREMVVEGEEEPPPRRHPTARVGRGWRGELAGVSLHVLAFRRDGGLVSEAWGGLELAHRAVEPVPGPSGAAILYPREKPFDDLEHLREGVAIALEPFLP